MAPPSLSIVLLTWNEETNIQSCLASLAKQCNKDFEVIVIDAASTDRTVELIHQTQRTFPVPLRLEVAPHRVPIGNARNVGATLAQAPIVAFLSADAEAHECWVEEATRSLQDADLVFGRQVHEPRTWTVGAAVRGLRYHFPDEDTSKALPYASNVGAAYRKEVLQAFPFDPDAQAAEDLLLARRAQDAGYHATYNHRMAVAHHDVATARDEWRKSVREGQGWGFYRDELGLFRPLLAWATLLLASLGLLVWRPGLVTLLFVFVILWLPALRRAARRHHDMPPKHLWLGVAASPLFDLVFLVNYVWGLLRSGSHRAPGTVPKESPP